MFPYAHKILDALYIDPNTFNAILRLLNFNLVEDKDHTLILCIESIQSCFLK